jgi:hypothetical protein
MATDEQLAEQSRRQGPKKAARPPGKPKGRKSASEASTGGGGAIDLRAKELAARAAGGDLDAVKAMERIVVSFERWKKALATAREERDATSRIVGAQEAAFGNAIEAPLESGSTAEAEDKLRRVEVAWQDLTEAKAERDERNATASDDVKKWANTLERAMREGAQLTLPGTD